MKKQQQILFFGEVLKTYGTNGELIVKISDNVPQKVNKKEPVFIVMDGLSVPFYLKHFEFKGTQKAVVIFDDRENELLASELIRKKIHFESDVIQESENEPSGFEFSDLIGFVACDSKLGELGEITDFFDYPNNPCFEIIIEGNEILIPVNEDLIEGISPEEKLIVLNLPDGLLDVYLDLEEEEEEEEEEEDEE